LVCAKAIENGITLEQVEKALDELLEASLA
jgi:hypothetical protein